MNLTHIAQCFLKRQCNITNCSINCHSDQNCRYSWLIERKVPCFLLPQTVKTLACQSVSDILAISLQSTSCAAGNSFPASTFAFSILLLQRSLLDNFLILIFGSFFRSPSQSLVEMEEKWQALGDGNYNIYVGNPSLLLFKTKKPTTLIGKVFVK